MGLDGGTGQYILYDGESVKFARTVMRVPDANTRDKDALSKVNATPWDFHKPRDVEIVFNDTAEKVDADFEDKVALS